MKHHRHIHVRVALRPLLWGCLVLVLCLTGCRSTKQVATPAPEVVTPEVPAPKRAYTVMNFTGEVEGISVNGQLRMAQDSVLWVSVNKLVELGRAMATVDSVWLHAPVMGRDDALDYAALQRLAKRRITYDDLQTIALAGDAEERIAALARQLGFNAKIHITRRRQVEHLTFPFLKPLQQ